MKDEEITTGNEIIAEFMGFDYNPTYPTAELLDYNSSLDWLMPVVEKIEEQENSIVNIKSRILNSIPFGEETKIEAIFKAVVIYVKWYNSQKK